MSKKSSNSNIIFAIIGLGVSILVIILKYLAYKFSLSIALEADAAETILNIVSAIGGLLTIYYAEQPADTNHTYGHYKAEYIFSVAEGTFILMTALLIAHSTWLNWHETHIAYVPVTGLILSSVATLVNLIWALSLKKIARKTFSPALSASAHHILSDVWNGILLVGGLALIPIFKLPVIDTILACVVIVNILINGWKVMRQSLSGLMDEAPDIKTQQEIRRLIAENGTGALEAHEIRMRIVGSATFLEFHLVVPGNICVNEAHAICDHIEKALGEQMRDTYVTIHVEPENHTMADSLLINPPPSCSLSQSPQAHQ